MAQALVVSFPWFSDFMEVMSMYLVEFLIDRVLQGCSLRSLPRPDPLLFLSDLIWSMGIPGITPSWERLKDAQWLCRILLSLQSKKHPPNLPPTSLSSPFIVRHTSWSLSPPSLSRLPLYTLSHRHAPSKFLAQLILSWHLILKGPKLMQIPIQD